MLIGYALQTGASSLYIVYVCRTMCQKLKDIKSKLGGEIQGQIDNIQTKVNEVETMMQGKHMEELTITQVNVLSNKANVILNMLNKVITIVAMKYCEANNIEFEAWSNGVQRYVYFLCVSV